MSCDLSTSSASSSPCPRPCSRRRRGRCTPSRSCRPAITAPSWSRVKPAVARKPSTKVPVAELRSWTKVASSAFTSAQCCRETDSSRTTTSTSAAVRPSTVARPPARRPRRRRRRRRRPRRARGTGSPSWRARTSRRPGAFSASAHGGGAHLATTSGESPATEKTIFDWPKRSVALDELHRLGAEALSELRHACAAPRRRATCRAPSPRSCTNVAELELMIAACAAERPPPRRQCRRPGRCGRR